MSRNFSAHERALVLFRSPDAIHWKLHENPIVTSREIRETNGRCVEYNRLERPQIYLEKGVPRFLYLAVKPSSNSDESYNIHLPVEFN